MQVLLAEDQDVSRRLLRNLLTRWGFQVVEARDGLEAWQILQQDSPPTLALIDWDMPGLTGPELCQRIRQHASLHALYIILLTAHDRQDDLVYGLQSGADDYMTKPYQMAELQARLETGRRVIGLQASLVRRIAELEQARSEVRQLHGLLPICAYCKSIRNDGQYWQQLEDFICQHAEVRFSHGVCPGCREAVLRMKRPVGCE